jgi:ATP-dependent Lon protease
MTDQQPPMDSDAEKVPELLPILPLFDAVLFPKMVLPLVVMQGESVQLVDFKNGQNPRQSIAVAGPGLEPV